MYEHLPKDQQRAVQRVLQSQPMPDRPKLPRVLSVIRLVFVGLCVSFLLMMVMPLVIPGFSVGLGIVVWLIALLVLVVVRGLYLRFWFQPYLKTVGCLLCPRCHFVLQGTPEHGQCPECGTFYTHSEVVRMWRFVYGVRAPRNTSSNGARIDDKMPTMPIVPKRLLIESRTLNVLVLITFVLGWGVSVLAILQPIHKQAVPVSLAVAGMFLPWLVLITIWTARRRAILALLDPNQGCVCLNCHFPLPASDAQGVCPECGRRYDRLAVVKAWCETHRLGDRYSSAKSNVVQTEHSPESNR
ncbi:MAG: hypothetical protein K2W85_09480 [Phycisphaerales bacterium]|nr:hypothetical protein [Phycisphaerales bacterium]